MFTVCIYTVWGLFFHFLFQSFRFVYRNAIFDLTYLFSLFSFTSAGLANIPEVESTTLPQTSNQDDEKWQQFIEGEAILKKGFVNKRKGLFARKRMFLLTTGPRLFYIDPVSMVKKGEIPWSADLRVEAKSFRIFFVHTVSLIIFAFVRNLLFHFDQKNINSKFAICFRFANI